MRIGRSEGRNRQVASSYVAVVVGLMLLYYVTMTGNTAVPAPHDASIVIADRQTIQSDRRAKEPAPIPVQNKQNANAGAEAADNDEDNSSVTNRTFDDDPRHDSGRDVQPALDASSRGAADAAFDIESCENLNREAVLKAARTVDVGSLGTLHAHMTKLFQLTREGSATLKCLQNFHANLKQKRDIAHGNDGRLHFFDLGSRMIDSTTNFLQHFPLAKDFRIYCFEANPDFNNHYPPFIKKHPNVRHFNYAVSVQNGTMTLSKRDVGSSIVQAHGSSLGTQHGSEVRTINWVEFFMRMVDDAKDGMVVIKMDIEKAEFSVLRLLIESGAIAFVDDLLLECHYDTNAPRDKRPIGSIGKDDCANIIESLNRVGVQGVDWSKRKTAVKYSKRHGGYFPT